MPLENNIKVQSSADIKGKIRVNVTELDPYEWISSVATDRGDGTIWIKDNYDTARAETIGSADVSEFAEVDLSELDNNTPGTYPVYTSFKGLEAEYQIEVKPMEMYIICSGMTKDFIEGNEPSFDGDCYANYSKESLSGYVEPTYSQFAPAVSNQWCEGIITYVDEYYNIQDDYYYQVRIHPEPDEDSAVMDFKNIEDFDEWTSGYVNHDIDFGVAIMHLTASHQGPDQPINDQPVTKAGPCIIETDEIRRYFDAVSIGFTQWGGKQQTVHLDYSEDGGITWEDSGLMSNDFWLRGNLPEGIYANKLRLRFDNASNQVGLCYGILFTHLEEHPIHRVKIVGLGSVSADETVTWTAKCIVPPESMNWEVVEGDGEVSLDPYEEEGEFCCDITGVSAGTLTIRATCEDGTYDEKEITVIGGGGGGTEYTESITFSNVYSTDTVLDGIEIDVGEQGYLKLCFTKSSGSSKPKYFANGSEVRVYGSNTISVYLADGIDGYLKSVQFTVEAAQKSFTSSVETLEWNGAQTTSTWSNTEGTNVTEVTFTAASGSGNTRFSSIQVTYLIND